MAKGGKECCNDGVLQYILFIFNFVFGIAGIVAIALGIWTVFAKNHYLSLLTTPVFAASVYILIAAGAILIIIASIGCVGLWKQKRFYVLTYAILLLTVFLMEIAVGVMGYLFQDKLRDDLKNNLNTTMVTGYSVDSDVTEAVDALQQSFQCCGAKDYDDWEYSTWKNNNIESKNTVPDTCCITYSPGCGGFFPENHHDNHPSQLFDHGCLARIEEEVKRHALIISLVSFGLGSIQLLGILFACCLYSKVNDEGYGPVQSRK